MTQQLANATKENLAATVHSESMLAEKDQLKMQLEEAEKEKILNIAEWEKEKILNFAEWEKEKKGRNARVVELEHQLAEAGRVKEDEMALVLLSASDRLADAVAAKELGTLLFQTITYIFSDTL